jgi:hypothetical protein
MIRRASVNLDKLTGDAAAENTLAGLGVAEIERRRVVHYSRGMANNLGGVVSAGHIIMNYNIPVSGRYDVSAICIGVMISGSPAFHLRIAGGAIVRAAAFNSAAGTLINFNASDTLDLTQGQVVELALTGAGVNLYDYGLTVAYRCATS